MFSGIPRYPYAMSTFRNPVGPQPPRVYWRRRLLLLLGAVAVIVVIVLIVARPGSGDPKAANTDAPKTTSAPKSTDAPAGKACAPANVKVEAVTDKESYTAAELPQISMKVTNIGAAACTINLGSTQQELIITSGSEQIWDSKDCQTGAVDKTVTLAPNKPLSTPAIPWNRTRSSKTTCASTTLPQVTAGGASYHLGVKIGSIASKDTVQFLLQ